MTAWTTSELLDLDRAAAKHARRAQELLATLDRSEAGISVQAMVERIRLAELTAEALREFAAIKRAGKAGGRSPGKSEPPIRQNARTAELGEDG
jgi:hypothetical protein